MVKTKAARRRHLVKALRSGDFKQTKGSLERTEPSTDGHPVGNCCLGVACRVALKDGLNIRVETDPRVPGVTMFAGASGFLPYLVREWYGLRAPGGEFNDGALFMLNDDQGATFEEIADVIEAAPEGLFVD